MSLLFPNIRHVFHLYLLLSTLYITNPFSPIFFILPNLPVFLRYTFTNQLWLFSSAIPEKAKQLVQEMSSAQRAWIVAASVGVVEALDQGVCRWNNTLKSAQHVIKNHVRSLSQAKNLSSKNLSSSSAMVSSSSRLKGKQSEEFLRTIMYLSCWGPNQIS